MSQVLAEVKQVSVDYQTRTGSTVTALSGFDLTISAGEFVSVVGPSGCGKSSLLRLLGGLQVPTSGSVRYRGQVLTGPRPLEVALVFQDFSLLPWRTVLANTEFGLELRKVPKAERRAVANRELERVGIADFADSYPRELSGGMQQRVGIARALAMGTELMLMDEPFGSLDEQTREAIGEEVARILTDVGKTCLLVTHSIGEAILLSDRIVVVSARPGRVMADIAVPGPRPRPADFMAEEAFVKLRTTIYRMLHAPSEASTPIMAGTLHSIDSSEGQ